LATALLCAGCCWLCSQGDDGDQPHGVLVEPAFVPGVLAKQSAPPLGALALGFGLYFLWGAASKVAETASIVLIYFGAQSGMHVYMKVVLSKIVIDEHDGLKGVPIGFLLTSIQQFVAFMAFGCFLLMGRLFSSGYQVKKLTTPKEYIAMLCFSVTFALNVGLNNFSLTLVPISVNLIIRSCMPLSTAVSQIAVGKLMGQGSKSIPSMDWAFMLFGVGCAALATVVRNKANVADASPGMLLGVFWCVASIFAGAINMVMAGVLGTEMKLNPLDTTCYMALPAGLVLLVPALVAPHPMTDWPGFPSMTDWEVLVEVMARKPVALVPVIFSGILAFCYNILQYTLVHKLSASYAAFAGNFNKAATVALSLLLGLEAVPKGHYGHIFVMAVMGNIAAFTVFSTLKAKK